jgi:hypothetical protein
MACRALARSTRLSQAAGVSRVPTSSLKQEGCHDCTYHG